MVFQHFSLFEALTVAENIALAMPGDFDLAALSKKIARVSKEYGLPLEPSAIVADLSVGERQRIEIVRCLLQEPKLLIMDEPTAVLTPQEADQLFVTLERLAREGCAVLYITHRLEEVKRLCHNATILRHGKVVAECRSDEGDSGEPRAAHGRRRHSCREGRAASTSWATCACGSIISSLPPDGPFAVALKDVSLEVHGGEIIAIAGVAGNGQSELFDAISGERELARADMLLHRRHASGQQRRQCSGADRGAAFVPEERLGHGAVPGIHAVRECRADPPFLRPHTGRVRASH